jgi:tetratricopeptide (TPR) repeat protein
MLILNEVRRAFVACATIGLFAAAAPAAEPPLPTATEVSAPPAGSPPPVARPVKGEWTEYRSAHFTVLADSGPRRTLDLLHRLERFRKILSMLYPKLTVDAPVDTQVLVFRDPGTLERFGPRYEGRAVEINGVFVPRPDANLILVNGSSQTDPLPTIYHEYMHYFTATNFPPLPVWFNEGLAECYETFRTDESTAEIGRVKEDHVAFLRGSILMPLEQLFSIGYGSRDYNEGDRRGVFYAESWAITHYLLWDNPQRKPQLADFLERLEARRPPVDAFREAFGTDLESFQIEIKRHIEQNRFHHTIAQFKDPSFEKEVRTRGVDPDEAAARLAEVAISFDATRAPEAEALLAPALATAAPPAATWRALGQVRAAQGKPDEAIEAYAKAVAADPSDARAGLFLGRAFLERSDAASIAAARATLRRVMQARPDLAEPAIAFGRALTSAPGAIGKPDLDFAIDRLQGVLKVLPYRADAAVDLTTLYVERGDLDRAEAFARSVLPRLTDPALVESMRAYIAARRPAPEASPDVTAEEADPSSDSPDDPPPLPPLAPPARTERTVQVVPVEGASGPAEGRPGVPDDAEVRRLQSINPATLREGEWYLVYNQAAALGNVRRYKEALALLDRLTPACRYPYLKDPLVALASRLRRDAARAGSAGR